MATDFLSRLMLGTAQLGMDYGVANRTGRPSAESARALVSAAIEQGVRGFDTAEVYGESEMVLGRIFESLGISAAVEVVTKGAVRGSGDDSFRSRIARSKQRLGVRQIAAWLLHDERQLQDWTEDIAEEAASVQEEGDVRSFGVSVYSPGCVLHAVDELGLDTIQIPLNPFDRRFVRSGAIARMHAAGTRVYVRSVYLQGLALMEPQRVPARIPYGREAAETFQTFCRENEIAPDRFCLHYALHRTAAVAGCLVVGLENIDQLERNCQLLRSAGVSSSLFDAWDALWPEDIDDLILPSRWTDTR